MNTKIVIGAALGVVILGGAGLIIRSKTAVPEYATVTVERKTIQQEVSVTGRVVPAEKADLAFERTGKVSRITKIVGDVVREGEVIIALETSELQAQKSQTEAAMQSSQAKLDELRRGLRPEEKVLLEAKVSSAQQALVDARLHLANTRVKAQIDINNLYGALEDIIGDAYITADDAVNQLTDDLFSDDTSNNPLLVFITSSGQAKSDAELWRLKAGKELVQFKAELQALSEDHDALDLQLQKTTQHLNVVKTFLDMLTTAINSAVGVSPTTLGTYKTDVNTGRGNINTSLTTITTRDQAITSQKAANTFALNAAETAVNVAQNALDQASLELSLKLAGASEEQISAQKALVEQARATVESINVQIEKSVLRAPFNGIITVIKPEVGEIAAVNTPAVGLISQAQFQIEANLPEVDLAKITVGNHATVSLDAYGEDVLFEATVSEIDPAETVIDSVATYGITLVFTGDNSRIRSGMTANVDIRAQQRENVLVLPQRTITSNENGRTVQVLEGGKTPVERTITIGLKGSDGTVEITSGVSEGDLVVIPTSQK
jgi:HlyD family secretion protein